MLQSHPTGWLFHSTQQQYYGSPNVDEKPLNRDASAYTLGYFSNDYVSSTTLGMQPSIFAGEHQGLYNGNIAAMMTEHKGVGFDEAVSVYGYSYDQLHRLKKGTHYNFLNNSYTLSRKYDTEYTYDPDGNLEYLERTGNQMATLMDNLSYEYDLPDKPNQLKQVTDAATDANPGQFIGQEVYEYDDIGNLTKNTSNGVTTEIEWDVYNKIKSVNSNSQLTKYLYDGAGNRIYSDVDGIQTGYVRDAQGNPLGIYNMTSEGDPFFWPQLKEVYLYGSSRFGVDRTFRTHPRLIIKNEWHKDLTTTRYEITNHLGNVLSTVTGRKLGIEDGVGLLDYYLPEVITASDYYAFGEQVCSSHTKWLVDAVKRSFRPAAKRGAISEVKTLCALAKVLLRITHAWPYLRKSRFFWNK